MPKEPIGERKTEMAEEHLDFPQFFRAMSKYFWLILLITAAAVLTSAFLSYYVLTPVYQAKVNMIVSTQQDPNQSEVLSKIDESLKLVTTYEDIVQSPFILKNAQLKLNTEGHNVEIDQKDISVEHTNESQVFDLLVENEEEAEAVLIANAIASTFDEHIKSIMNTKVKNVKIMNNAAVDPDPVSPQPLLIIGCTFIISFILSIWLVLLIHNVKKTRKPS
jgi:capsular polysaccharide biosynthesis protein